MTWGECKEIALRKMFASDGGRLDDSDPGNADYIAAMPAAANDLAKFSVELDLFIMSQGWGLTRGPADNEAVASLVNQAVGKLCQNLEIDVVVRVKWGNDGRKQVRIL